MTRLRRWWPWTRALRCAARAETGPASWLSSTTVCGGRVWLLTRWWSISRFQAWREHRHGVYLKMGLRRVLAIAVTNVTIVLARDGAGPVSEARIALGSVAPTIVRAPEAEAALVGTLLTDTDIEKAAALAVEAARPIDDVRGSAWYRREEVAALVRRCLESLRSGDVRMGLPQPDQMVKLWGKTPRVGTRRWPHLSGRQLLTTRTR